MSIVPRAVVRDRLVEYELIPWTVHAGDRGREGMVLGTGIEFSTRTEAMAFLRRTELVFGRARLRALGEELGCASVLCGVLDYEAALARALVRGQLLVFRRVLEPMVSEQPELGFEPEYEQPELPPLEEARAEARLVHEPKLSARAGVSTTPPPRVRASVGLRPSKIRARVLAKPKRLESRVVPEPKRVESRVVPEPKRLEARLKLPVPPPPEIVEPVVEQPQPVEPVVAPIVAPSHYFEALLVDEHHRAIRGEPYRVELADGSVETGETDRLGVVRIDGVEPGTCKLSFPRLDASSWAPTTKPPYVDLSGSKPDPLGEPVEPAPSYFEAMLLDEHERAIVGELYELELPDGSLRTGETDDLGSIRLEGVEPGTCKLSFPRLDGSSWEPK